MNHYVSTDNEINRSPIGDKLAIKFPYDGDEYNKTPRAALVEVTNDLCEKVDAISERLNSNPDLHRIEFYWPMFIVTNEVYGQPIPKQYTDAIFELLNSEFSVATADTVACEAIGRVCSMDAMTLTWISVERPVFVPGGARVFVGCTILFTTDYKEYVIPLTGRVKTEMSSYFEDPAKNLTFAVQDLARWLEIEDGEEK